MEDKETPRSMIQGYLITADTQKSDVGTRKRKPIPRTPDRKHDRLSRTLPERGSERLSSVKRRRVSQTEDITPRSMIEKFVTSTKTVLPSVKKTKRRRSVATPVGDITDITTDKFTPRTNIQGILSQAIEETPYERPITRSGRRSELPPIPHDQTINLRLSSSGSPSHDDSRLLQRRGQTPGKKERLADRVRRKQFNFHRLSLKGKENRPTAPSGESDIDYPTPHSGSSDSSNVGDRVSSQEDGTLGDIESGAQTAGSPSSPLKTASLSYDVRSPRRSPRTLEKSRRESHSSSPTVNWSPLQSPSTPPSRKSLAVGSSPSLSKSAKEGRDEIEGSQMQDRSTRDSLPIGLTPKESTKSPRFSVNSKKSLGTSVVTPSKNTEVETNAPDNINLSQHMSVPRLDISVPGVKTSSRSSRRRSMPISPSEMSPNKEDLNVNNSSVDSNDIVEKHSGRPQPANVVSASPGGLSIGKTTPNKSYKEIQSSPRRSLRSNSLLDISEQMHSSQNDEQPSKTVPESMGRTTTSVGTPSSGETNRNITLTRSVRKGTASEEETNEDNLSPAHQEVTGSLDSGENSYSRSRTPQKGTPSKLTTGSSIRKVSRGTTSKKDLLDDMSHTDGHMDVPQESYQERTLNESRKGKSLCQTSVTDYYMARGSENRRSSNMHPDVSAIPGEGEEYTGEVSELNETELYRIKTPHLQSVGQERPTPITSTPLHRQQKATTRQENRANTERRKPRQRASLTSQSLPPNVIKQTFAHFCKMKVTKDVLPQLIRITDRYFDNVMEDLEAYAKHGRRMTIDETDTELLMKRQGHITQKQSLTLLVEKYLPLELRQEIIPMATSGNHIIPE